MRVLVALAFVAACTAVPVAELNSVSHGSDEVPKPLVNSGPLVEELDKMLLRFYEEARDESAEHDERVATAQARLTSLNATLNTAITAHAQAVLSRALCSARVGTNTHAVGVAERAVQDSVARDEVRHALSKKVGEEGAEWAKDARRHADVVAELWSRIKKEVDSQKDARGNGIRFDAFVRDHPNAMGKLRAMLDVLATLRTKLEARATHTVEAATSQQLVLACSACEGTTHGLADSPAALRLAVDAKKAQCDADEKAMTVEHAENVVREVQRDIDEAESANAAQAKEEKERADKLDAQIQEVTDLKASLHPAA